MRPIGSTRRWVILCTAWLSVCAVMVMSGCSRPEPYGQHSESGVSRQAPAQPETGVDEQSGNDTGSPMGSPRSPIDPGPQVPGGPGGNGNPRGNGGSSHDGNGSSSHGGGIAIGSPIKLPPKVNYQGFNLAYVIALLTDSITPQCPGGKMCVTLDVQHIEEGRTVCTFMSTIPGMTLEGEPPRYIDAGSTLVVTAGRDPIPSGTSCPPASVSVGASESTGDESTPIESSATDPSTTDAGVVTEDVTTPTDTTTQTEPGDIDTGDESSSTPAAGAGSEADSITSVDVATPTP